MAGLDRWFARVTVGLLAAGLLCAAAALGRDDPWPLLMAAAAWLGLAGLLHLFRFVRPSWRPVRTRVFTVHLAYLALFVTPSALTALHPGRSLFLAGGVIIAYFSFHAFREAFSAAEGGVCSPRGFLVIIAGAVTALVALRFLGGLHGAPGPWLVSLAGDPAAPGRDFDRLFDVLLVGAFPLLATRAGEEDSPRGRWLWGGSSLLAAAGILVAFGRAAWLALFLELALLLVYDRRRRVWLTAVLGTVILAGLLLPGGGERARTIMQAGQLTNSQRLEQWAAALELTASSPLLGHGLGSFGELYPRFGGSYAQRGYVFPHSLPLHLAAECGLPALFLFVAWMAWFFAGWQVGNGEGGAGHERRLRALRLGAKIAAAGMLLFSLFDL